LALCLNSSTILLFMTSKNLSKGLNLKICGFSKIETQSRFLTYFLNGCFIKSILWQKWKLMKSIWTPVKLIHKTKKKEMTTKMIVRKMTKKIKKKMKIMKTKMIIQKKIQTNKRTRIEERTMILFNKSMKWVKKRWKARNKWLKTTKFYLHQNTVIKIQSSKYSHQNTVIKIQAWEYRHENDNFVMM
jgi:hypothetical protein